MAPKRAQTRKSKQLVVAGPKATPKATPKPTPKAKAKPGATKKPGAGAPKAKSATTRANAQAPNAKAAANANAARKVEAVQKSKLSAAEKAAAVDKIQKAAAARAAAAARKKGKLPSQEINESGFGPSGIPTWALFETVEVAPSNDASLNRQKQYTYKTQKSGKCAFLREGRVLDANVDKRFCGPGQVLGTTTSTEKKRCYTFERFKPAGGSTVLRRPLTSVSGPCKVATKYTPFTRNVGGGYAYAPRQTTANERARETAGPPKPPVCAAEIAAAAGGAFDPVMDACFKRDMADRNKPLLSRISEGKWLCDADGKRPKIGPHQGIVYEFAKMLAGSPRAAVGNRRGLLVWHNTGSGKTVTAMGIIAAFWDSGRKINMCTTNANMASNNLTEYAQNALLFFPAESRKIFAGKPPPPPPDGGSLYSRGSFQHPNAGALKAWCAGAGAATLKSRVTTWSFWRLGSIKTNEPGRPTQPMRDYLHPTSKDGKSLGSVLIIDEAQNLFKPSKSEQDREGSENLRKHLLKDAAGRGDIMLFSLTATPGDTAQEYMSMLNIVRPTGAPVLTLAEVVADPTRARGLLSYADIRGDKTHYGTIVGGPKNYEVPHSPAYYAAYLAAFTAAGSAAKPETRDLDKNPDAAKDYYLKSRVAGCILGKTAAKTFYSDEDWDLLKKQKPVPGIAVINSKSEVVLSEKMKAALANAMKSQGKQYVYVPDPNTLKAAVSALKLAGMEQFKAPAPTSRKVKDPETGAEKTEKVVVVKDMSNKPRFFAYYGGVLDGETVDSAQQKGVQNFFKSDKNLAGEKLKIFVTTEYEGLDLWHLRNVHLVAPLPTQALDDQAVGRALRYCGHKGNATSVTVARYFGVAPPSEQVAEALEGAGGVTKAGKPRKTRGDKLEKVQAAEAELLALNEQLAKAGYSERPKARDANSYVYYDALRRAAPLEAFLTCLKGVSIECGLLDQIQAGPKITCGAACNVKLNAAGTDIQSAGGSFKPAKTTTTTPNKPNKAPATPAPSTPAPFNVKTKTTATPTPSNGKTTKTKTTTTPTATSTKAPANAASKANATKKPASAAAGKTYLNKGVRVAVRPRSRSPARAPPGRRRAKTTSPGIVQQILNFLSGRASSPPPKPKRTKYAGQTSGLRYA